MSTQGKVLVVDDTEANRYTIVRILQKAGFAVVEAVNGRAGLAAASAELDLIILDIRMPEMDGHEAAARLKADPVLGPIPILHISATYTENKDIAHGLEGGADGYLTHPVDPEVLVATVRAFVRIRRADRALRASEARARGKAEELQALMGAVPAAVIIAHDAECATMTGNPAARELLRIPESTDITEWPGYLKVFRGGALLSASELPMQTAAREAAPVTGTDLEFEFRDGSRAHIHGGAAPLFDEAGNVRGVVGAFVDVTERIQAQAQLERAQRMESIGRLAGGIAHETNNQMAVVLGFTEFVARGANLTPDQQLDLAQVKGAAERVAHLTRQLLALSRQQMLRSESLDFDALVRETLTLIARLLGPDVPVSIRSDDSPKWVRADRTQLVQVLLNLAINARDAMPKGGELRIVVRRVSEVPKPGRLRRIWRPEDDIVMFTVSDSGTGIDPEVSTRMFEPFFTTKPLGQGTGLGLSVVEGIVEQSGGDIWVESRVGEGTSLSIALPLVEWVPAHPAVAAQSPRGGTETLLVVEDEDVLRGIFARGLAEQGYRVLEAANGQEALAIIESTGELDLVVSDLVMPEINGVLLARTARAKYPQLPFIFVTGQHRPSEDDDAGPSDESILLQKPFAIGQLVAAVRRALDDSVANVPMD